MTFDEAIKSKIEIGETIKIENLEYKVFVVPSFSADIVNYLGKYKTQRFTDESAKLFSNNSEFKVYAIWHYLGNFLYKELKG
jgi:hypothetical protein